MKYNIILASNSPRRQQLLADAGISFQVWTKPVDEDFPADLPVLEVAEYLARKKGKAYQAELQKKDLLITADTTVVVDQLLLNKPGNPEEARYMLKLLSGRSHLVVTGVCISSSDRQISFKDITRVYFRKLKEEEIDHYIRQYEPYDKAGAYAIQEWIGMIGIERIEGSYFNVVGLPISKLYAQLCETESPDH